MVRVAVGLLCVLFPVVLELRGEMDGSGAVRAAVWVGFAALGLCCLVLGARAVWREATEERAAREIRSRYALSAPSRSTVQAAALLALAVLTLAAQNEVEAERGDWPPAEEILHLPRREALRVMSLGYRELAADFVWLRAISYFGDHLQTDRKYRWLDRYLETVIHLDPRFRSVYKYAGAVTMYNLRRITKEAVLQSNFYLERGYKLFPDYWEFPFMICSNYLFEMPRYARDAAEKRRFQEIGAEYCREASLLPGALHYLPTMAGGVLTRLGKRQLAERHFRELLLRTEDKKLRRQLQERYAALVSAGAAGRLAREAEAFYQAHRASYPFLPADLFVLVGPRDGAAPDAAAEIRRVLSR
jgi:hypothetical protein